MIWSFILLNACTPIFSEDDCSDKLMNSTTSDDGQFVANVVRRDCGATTAPANTVYLKNKLEKQEGDGSWGEKVYVLQGEESIPLRWKGSSITLQAPTEGKNVFLKKELWKGIVINYE